MPISSISAASGYFGPATVEPVSSPSRRPFTLTNTRSSSCLELRQRSLQGTTAVFSSQRTPALGQCRRDTIHSPDHRYQLERSGPIYSAARDESFKFTNALLRHQQSVP